MPSCPQAFLGHTITLFCAVVLSAGEGGLRFYVSRTASRCKVKARGLHSFHGALAKSLDLSRRFTAGNSGIVGMLVPERRGEDQHLR